MKIFVYQKTPDSKVLTQIINIISSGLQKLIPDIYIIHYIYMYQINMHHMRLGDIRYYRG